MIARDKLDQITARFQFLEAKMQDGAAPGEMAALGREYAEIKPVAETVAAWRALIDAQAEAEAMRDDPEMRALAEEELPRLRERIDAAEAALQIALLPRDAADARPAMVEIRPGTGGDEAALFAADLWRMYQRYAEARGWRVEVIEEQATELGGLKELVARIEGEGVFARLKYESGVHRVQRVPVTESSGRIHTSAATVAVLPEAQAVDIEIDMSEVEIQTFKSGGAGGQNVQKNDTAVRLTHKPTGLVVICQDERSQLQNREKALRVLRSRLLDMERQQKDEERASARRDQVRSGDRSEKIRTYNFPQNRATDHRIGLTLHQLDQVMEGRLQPIIDALTQHEREERLRTDGAAAERGH